MAQQEPDGTTTFLGRHDTPGTALRLSLTTTRIYVADAEGGVQVLSKSGTPRFVGSVATPGHAQKTVVDGGLLFVADLRAGMMILPEPCR